MVQKSIRVSPEHFSFVFLNEALLPESCAILREQLTPAHESIRIRDCTVKINTFKEWLQLPYIRKIQFENSFLTTDQTSQLAIELLELNSTLEVSYTPPFATSVYSSPIWYYHSLLVWKKAWWVEPVPDSPSELRTLISRFQTILTSFVLLQMRFYRVLNLYHKLELELLTHPEFTTILANASLLRDELKKLQSDCPPQTSAIFIQLIEDLSQEAALYTPRFSKPVSYDVYLYYVFLDHYKKLRVILASCSNQVLEKKTLDYPESFINYALTVMGQVSSTDLNFNALILTCILYCQELNIIRFEITPADEQAAFSKTLFQFDSLIYRVILQLKDNPKKLQLYHQQIAMPLYHYVDFLDKQLSSSDDKGLKDLLLHCVGFLLACVKSRPNNIVLHGIFLQTMNRFSKVEERFNPTKTIQVYAKELNDIMRPLVAEIQVKKIQLNLDSIQGVMVQQLWMLTKATELNSIHILGILTRITTSTKTNLDARPSAFFHLSRSKQRTALNYKLVGWDTKACIPPFDPLTRNPILDINEQASQGRVLFEKIVFYLFDSLKQLPEYLTELKKITDASLTTQYPSLMFCSYSSTVTITNTLYEEQVENFLTTLVAAFSIVSMPSTEEFELPTLDTLTKVTLVAIKHAEHYLELVSRVCQFLMSTPELSKLFDTQLDQNIALNQKQSYQKISDLCQLRQAKLRALVAEREIEVKKVATKHWEAFTKKHQPVSLEVKRENHTKDKEKQGTARTKPAKTTVKDNPEPKQSAVKKIQPQPQEKLPRYVKAHPKLKNIHLLLQKKNYDEVIEESQIVLTRLLSDSLQQPTLQQFPILAYLYYVIAESMGMQTPEVEPSVIFDMLYRGYEYANEFIASESEVDDELMNILLFLKDETEASPLFNSKAIPVKIDNISKPEAKRAALKNNDSVAPLPYIIALPTVVRNLQTLLFSFFQPECQFFYGSFVSAHLIAYFHPDKEKLTYNDVDIAIITEDYEAALEFVAALPGFNKTFRPGLFTGTFLQHAFDIQILDAYCVDVIAFANTLAIGCRSAIADHRGVCFDFTHFAFSDIKNKVTRFLSSTHFESNPLALLNHIRTQAQFEFSSNEIDDKTILTYREHLLSLPNWLLRDYFSRHFQSGFAEQVLPLWKKYKLFEILWPNLADCHEAILITQTVALDKSFHRLQKAPFRITFLLALFGKIVAQHQQFIDFSAPLLQKLPNYAVSTIHDSVRFFSCELKTKLPERDEQSSSATLQAKLSQGL